VAEQLGGIGGLTGGWRFPSLGFICGGMLSTGRGSGGSDCVNSAMSHSKRELMNHECTEGPKALKNFERVSSTRAR
jgi:hypothetical protein